VFAQEGLVQTGKEQLNRNTQSEADLYNAGESGHQQFISMSTRLSQGPQTYPSNALKIPQVHNNYVSYNSQNYNPNGGMFLGTGSTDIDKRSGHLSTQ
jgi:hypothetical protein